MGASSWAIPVGILSAIVVIGFIFTWFWFPRAWQHGVNHTDAETAQAQGSDREEQRQKNRDTIERFARSRAVERGEIRHVDIAMEAPPPVYAKPPPVYQAKDGDMPAETLPRM